MSLLDEKSITEELQKVQDNFAEELKKISTGRLRPDLIETLPVKAYGGDEMELKSLTTIELRDGKFRLQPWDRGVIEAIELAIRSANMGLNPDVKDNVIFVTASPLTQESRQKRVKELKELLENAKVRVRQIRHKVIDEVEAMKSVSEDDQNMAKKKIQQLIDKGIADLESIAAAKEDELLTV